MPTTLADIAIKAGVSTATVSCILNDRTAGFNAETCRRVRRIASSLHYRPNANARAVRRGRCDNITLVIGTEPRGNFLPEDLLAGLCDGCQGHHLRLTILRLSDEELGSPQAWSTLLNEIQCDGLLINYHEGIPANALKTLGKLATPTIWLNSTSPKRHVVPNHRLAGRQACEWLLDMGHQHMLYADYFPRENMHESRKEIRQGYQDAMVAAGLVPRYAENTDSIRYDQWEQLTNTWLKSDDPTPTAIVCYNYELASAIRLHLGLIKGLRCPSDLSIVAVASDDRLAEVHGINLVVLPWYDVGLQAIDALLDGSTVVNVASTPCKQIDVGSAARRFSK